MRPRWLVLVLIGLALLASLLANLAIGAVQIGWSDVLAALVRFDPDSYDHFVVVYQRLPRALIAIYTGALMAVGGTVLQGLTRNPLASPSTLGINAGAMLFVIVGAYTFDLGLTAQGIAALAGAVFGFASCLSVARLAGLSRDPRGLALILSGALVSMLFVGIANAFLLADPARRTDFLGWITGNINHVYADRLADFWWIGLLSFAILGAIARPLTLVMLGQEKASSAGVNITWVTRAALAAVTLGAGSAVAICGPIGFVGLVVPHIVRPFIGAGLGLALPAGAMTGAIFCLIGDLVARQAFTPYVLHTGVLMDLIGGIVFVAIVRRFYLTPGARGET
ncbi:iron complex transport system permease protein [Breoghania corrubedonensis]|uniref:Iron complex transport system permease protein n=1 Tax=Breoghania corrubedonensis TaxID=665038 RepID=A0A2T5UYI1_9HYPH|nr:iron ABC transporter permease [Breoghania corrubedonensis]PTW56558.1 iron complex transport system permease protein [Breoghania corrubedonensis]